MIHCNVVSICVSRVLIYPITYLLTYIYFQGWTRPHYFNKIRGKRRLTVSSVGIKV